MFSSTSSRRRENPGDIIIFRDGVTSDCQEGVARPVTVNSRIPGRCFPSNNRGKARDPNSRTKNQEERDSSSSSSSSPTNTILTNPITPSHSGKKHWPALPSVPTPPITATACSGVSRPSLSSSFSSTPSCLGGYRPVPLRTTTTTTSPTPHHQRAAQSRVTLNTSFESASTATSTLTMTSLEWVRCGSSGGKVCIFLVLGIILLMLGIFIGAFYLNIQQLTSSSALTEILPNYVIALSVMLIGFCVIILFWKRSRVLLFISMVLNVSGFLLCVLTTILTGTHILKPIVSIRYCEYRPASKVCLCHSPYKRKNLTMNYSENKLFTLPFYGSSSCNIKTLLPKMLYVLSAITLIAGLVCAISYVITLRVYRMKKNKQDELDDEAFDQGDLQHTNRDDSYLSSRCHDNTYTGIPPSPESPVPLLEAVSSRGISIVDKSSILRGLLPDFGKKRIVKRSQSFSYHGRSVEGTCDSLEERSSSRQSKGRNVPCRTLSETVRPSSAGTPDNPRRKLSKQEGRSGTEDNLDNRQLLLILGLHMRNIQEQHQAEIESIQQEHMRRSKTPQPYYPVGKEGYMVGRRAYTPQPAKSQFPTPKSKDGYSHVQPPRRRQLFADNEGLQKPARSAKVFAEAMMNDMAYEQTEDLSPQEQIEMEPLPFCSLDGIPDHEIAQKMTKIKQSDTFYIPKPTTAPPYFLNSAMVDSKKMSVIGRTLSNTVPSKNDSVFIVPLYEKIDTPEHDMLQSSVHERRIPVSDGQQIYRRTPSPYGVKPSSSESLYSKATKPADPLYGRIAKKTDQNSAAQLEQIKNYKYVGHSPKKDISHMTNMADIGPKSRHYAKSPEERIEFSPHMYEYAVKESSRETPSNFYHQDMLDLSVTPESLTSDFSPGDSKQERGNISGTSTEFSPPGNNPNRSNASGTSVDNSPSAFQEVKKLCDTPIVHPKMLPKTPTESPTSPDNDTSYRQLTSHRSRSIGIHYSPDGHNLSGNKMEYSRNVTGQSDNFSPIEPLPQYLSQKRIYSPSRHVVETDKSISCLDPDEKITRGNISGASAKHSPCRNVPHSPVAQMLTPKMAPAIKEAILNNRTVSEPQKRNMKHNKNEQCTNSVRSRSASVSPHRNGGDDSLGPREQPYGQYGPYTRKIEGCNVYISPSKKDRDRDDNVKLYKGQKWNSDVESQPRKEKPPPPYPSRQSHNGPSSKSHGESSRKNISRGRAHFRQGPEGVSYRRKKVEKLDMSFEQVEDFPRSELDVEGDVDREELYPTAEKNRILAEYEYRKHLEDSSGVLMLRDKGSGSDSDALETVI